MASLRWWAGVYAAASTLLTIIILVLVNETVHSGSPEPWMWIVSTLATVMGVGWTSRNMLACRRCRAVAAHSCMQGLSKLFNAMDWVSRVMLGIVIVTAGGGLSVYALERELGELWSEHRDFVGALVLSVQVAYGMVNLGTIAWMVLWPVALWVLARRLRAVGLKVQARPGPVVGAPAPVAGWVESQPSPSGLSGH
jgi:hypothetical protein